MTDEFVREPLYPVIDRTCRACGRRARRRTVDPCPNCGEPYGRITFGMDSAGVAWQTDTPSERQARFMADAEQARRDRIRDLASQPRDE